MPRTVVTLRDNTYSLAFNGSSSYVSLGASGPVSLATSAFTLEAIIAVQKTGNTQTIIGDTTAVLSHFYWQISPELKLASYCHTTGLAGSQSGGASLVPGQFYRLHLSYDGANFNQYIDGVLDQSVACTGTVTASSTVCIGRGFGAGRYFKGNIKLLRYWTRALTQGEITSLVTEDNNNSSLRSGLVAEWLFEQGTGSTLTDSVGSDNGTIVSSQWSYVTPTKRRSQVGKGIPASTVQFNGSTQVLTVANSASLNPTSAITGVAWFYPRAIGATGTIVFDKSLLGVTNSYYLSISTNGTPLNYFEIGGVTKNFLTSEQRVLLREPNIVGFWYDGATLRTILYNSQTRGLSSNSLAATGSIGTNTSALRIGNSYTASFSQANGFIYRPRLWNRALSVNELDSLFYDLGHVSDGCILDLQMTEGTGTTVADSSGNSNNGTLAINTWGSNPVSSSRSVAANRVAVRNRPYSLQTNGSTSVISKSSPTGLPTGTSPRSVITSMFFATDTVSCVVDMHVNGAQSFGPILGNLAGSYVLFSDRINVGNNLMMTREEFYRYIGIGQWRRIVYTYDGATTLKLYVDGVLVKTATLGVALNTGTINTLLVASGQTAAQGPLYPFNGYVQDTVICSTELTPTEVAGEYFANITPQSAVFRMLADEGTGSTAADSIGSNSCSLSSTTWSSNSMFRARAVVT